MVRPKGFNVIDLTRFIAIGVAATLVACIEDPAATEEADVALGSECGNGSGGCVAQPRLDVTLDRSAITTELATSNAIVVTLTGSGGFGGTATLSASLRDPAGNPLPGWTIALDAATILVPQNGTATATATVTIPSENRGLVGTARIAVTSSAQTGTSAAQATLTALNQITFPIGITGGLCVYPSPSTVTVKIGTKLRWLNLPTNTSDLTIHVNSNPYGVFHQPTFPASAPGQTYEQTVSGTPSTSILWYCHSPGLSANNLIQPVN
jgi:plastocyanin